MALNDDEIPQTSASKTGPGASALAHEQGRSKSRWFSSASWCALILILSGLWVTQTMTTPLINVALLPLMISARWLGRTTALGQALVICISYGAAAIHGPAAIHSSAAIHGSVAFHGLAFGSSSEWLVTAAALLPFVVAALLTSSLSADVSSARAQLRMLDHHDALTGMLNLHSFNAKLQRQHAQAERDKTPYALLHVDVDKLRSINESYGLAAGNEALVLVSRCLQRSIRASDAAARLSGDEFALLLVDADPQVAELVSNRLRHNVYNTTLDVRSRMIRINVSIGVSNFPKDARSVGEMTSLADRRKTRDKELRRAPAR